MKMALVAELTLVVLLVGCDPFGIYHLILLLLLATQSLWIRGTGWLDAGLWRPASIPGTLLVGVGAAVVVLIAVRALIVPAAAWIAGTPVDVSALGEPGDTRNSLIRLGQAWTLAAFCEEMVFRGYLIPRIEDLLGGARRGLAIALIASSALFGLAHQYQGLAGVIATGTIGGLLALLYLVNRRNLWTVIICHGVVDTVALSALYFRRGSWLYGS